LSYSGAEYWNVIYRAVGDFSDLIADAAKARAALAALGDTAKTAGSTEAEASNKAALAHKTDTTAINDERRAMEMLADSAKRAQQWTEWGGRSDAGAHMADMARMRELKRLINIQNWLNFSTPQAAYAWRERERLQAIQMNYALWGGYTTPDQYLGYLQRQRTDLAGLNSTLTDRAMVYRENTDAALAYANALRGSHSSVAQLSTGLDLSGISQFQSALVGLPDAVSTRLELDDSAALTELVRYESLLRAVPQAETTVLTSSQERGAAPVTGQPVPEVIPVSFGGPYERQYRQILAEVAALARLRPEIPVSYGAPGSVPGGGLGSEVIPVSYSDPGSVPEGKVRPEVIPVSYGGPYKEQFAAILAEMARLDALRAVIPVRFDLPSASEITSFLAHLPVGGVTEPVHLVSQGGGAGGGGGPPPVSPGAAAEPPDGAAGKWLALGAAEKTAGDDAAGAGIKFKAAATALDTLGGSAQRVRGWWGLLAKDFTLFAGLFGSAAIIGTIAGWHIVLDAIIEVFAVLIPALVTATAGLIGWGAAAYDSGQKVYNQMKNVLTVSSALDKAIPPLKGHFEDLVNAVRPQVFQLFGDALDLLNGKTGVFQDLIMKTGHTLDYFSARLVVDLQQGGKGLQTFFDAGTKILGMFGQILLNLGHALMGFLRATEITHIAEDLLAVVTVLSKLLDIIARLPVPLLAAVIGFHGLAVWGGLAVTWASKLAVALVSVFGAAGPLNGVMATLASRLGASDAQLVKMAGHAPAVRLVAEALGQNAAGVAQFAVAADKSGRSVRELATSTEKGAALFGKYAAGLDKAGQGAVALAIAAGGAESQVAKVAASSGKAAAGAGFFASALGKVGGLAGLATAGLVTLAAAAGFFAYKALTARDNAQQWIDSINKGLASQSLFTVIGKNMADLAAVTSRLSNSQGLNAQAARELTGAQTELSDNLALALPRVGQVSRAYGVNMVGALQLLNLAGVKTADLFTRQGLVWQTDLQMVRGLVDGYQAMGQQLGTVGSDLNVLLVSESDQIKSMTKLNQAWDQWLTTVTGGESTFVKVQQDFLAIDTAQQTAGASMTGLNKQSLTLRGAFISMVPDAGKVLDAIRLQTATMEDGAKGGALLTRATRDLAAEMIPLAGHSADARAAVLALAQEADPSITTWQKLTRWVGSQGASGAASDLQKVLFQLAIPVSDLQRDAAKLSNTLQGDLTPAMANAEFSALGGQKAFSTFAADLAKFGPGSQITVDAGKRVAQMLLSIDKNSATAKAQFVAWGESMGLTQKQAGTLWATVSKGETPLTGMRAGLAASATASDNLARSGFWGQRRDQFFSNLHDASTWFSKTLPDAFVTAGHGAASFAGSVGKTIAGAWSTAYESFMRGFGTPIAKGWDTAYQAFFRGFASPLVSWFATSLPHGISAAWDKAWSGLVSPVVHVFDSIKTAVTGGFDKWWASHGDEVKQVWRDVTGFISGSWDKTWADVKNVFAGVLIAWGGFVAALEGAWKTLVGWFTGGGDLKKVLTPMWQGLVGVVQVVAGLIEGIFKVLYGVIELGAKVAWALVAATAKTAFDAIAMVFKTMWDAAMLVLKVAWAAAIAVVKIAWDIFVGAINVALDLLTGHWSKAWHDMLNTFKQVGNAIKDFFETTWKASMAFLDQLWHNFENFYKQLWDNALAFLKQAWRAFWSWFDNVIIGNFRNFFTRTIPHWFSGFVNEARSAWSSAWNLFHQHVVTNFANFFTRTIPAWWREFVSGGRNALSQVASSIEGSFKNSINWVISNVINRAIGFINDVTSIVGIPRIRGVARLAAGGEVDGGDPVAMAPGSYVPQRMAHGSVPGTGDEDGTHVIAMGGEYMLRKPARMALESVYGRGFMDRLNQADTWLGAGSRGNPASQRRRPGVNAAAAGGVQASPFMAGGGLVNPIGSGLRPERVDMGVDYGGFGALRALGSGQITSVDNSGWPGGTFIDLRLSPPYGSGYWFYAEDIQPAVRVGQGVSAGQLVGHAYGGPSGIEVGWASGVGGQTAAARDGQSAAGQRAGDPGKYPTAWGVAASNLIKSLGGPGGIISGPIQGGTAGIGGLISAIWQNIEGLLNSAGTGLSGALAKLGGLVKGGAGELLKLARLGGRAVFDGIWSHTIQPLVSKVIPGGDRSAAGAVLGYGMGSVKKGLDTLFGAKDSAAQSSAAAQNASFGGGTIGPVSGPADAGPGQAENYAKGRLSAYGWGSAQMGPLSQLWMRESGWNRFARNPSSGAYGIPQSLPESKLPPAGRRSGGSHASPQVDWGLGYIKGRYGSPAGAWSHETSAGWYAGGGAVGSGDDADLMGSLFAGGGAVGDWTGEPYAAGGVLADDDMPVLADDAVSLMAEGGAVTALRKTLAAEQAGEKAKYSGLTHAFAVGPAKYLTALTRQELGTLSRNQSAELSAYSALAGTGLTTTHLHHLGAEARAERATASDKELNRAASLGGHPAWAADLRKYLSQLSTTSSGTVPAGTTGGGSPVPVTAPGIAALRKKLAAEQSGEKAKYHGLEHAFAAGPAKYRTKLIEQELHTLTSRQAAEQAAYAALAGKGLTTAHLHHLGATARAEMSTASDKALSRMPGGHPGYAYDLRKYLAELSTTAGTPVSAGPRPGAGPVPPPVSAVPGLAPEWTDASSLTGAMGALNTAVVSVESPAFWKLMGEKLPAKATRSQHATLAAWDRALEAQQYRTIGLGHSPPGAYDVIHKHLFSPAKITAGQWGTFSHDVDRLVKEEAGTGIKGGINPPGTPANSGHVPWQYFHAQWQALRSGLLKVQQRIPLAQKVWSNIYGPAHLPYTPGPHKPPLVPPQGGLPDIMPEATMGGPAMPVMPGSGVPDMGFAAGGVPDMGFAAGGGVGDVAAMFSGGLSPGATMLPLVVRFGVPDTLMRQLGGGDKPARGEFPRRLSEAGASHYGPALNVEQLNINNPLPQRPSDSIAHASARMAFLAGRGMN
jgi:hypothetical protein